VKNNFLVAMMVLSAPVTNYAGQGRGGGNLIESQFRSTTVSILASYQSLPKHILSGLTFDLNGVLAALSKPGTFSPKCASGLQFDYLRKNVKTAFVFSDQPNVVYLDCGSPGDSEADRIDRERMVSEWKMLFRYPLRSKGFFVHEALRTLNIEQTDDDYSQSGSLTAVEVQLLNEVERRSEITKEDPLFPIISQRLSQIAEWTSCKIGFDSMSVEGTWGRGAHDGNFYLMQVKQDYPKGVGVFSSARLKVNYWQISDFMAALTFGSHKPKYRRYFDVARRDMYRAAIANQCY